MLNCKIWSREERIQRLEQLVQKFALKESYYKSKEFVEAEVRQEFIDPFLEILGWDIRNEKNALPAYKEVIVEGRLKLKGQVNHPDYTLRFGGQNILYIEAKQPSVNLKDDVEPAFQVRRYGYTAKMPLCLLTDFEELSVYNTTIQPKETDKAAVARDNYFNYKDYVKRFDELWKYFSYEAVDCGRFNEFSHGIEGKKGTTTVDDDLLETIETWRIALANDIAQHNGELDEYTLTAVVQKLVDRLMFMRICEDKQIEPYGQLQEIIKKNDNYYLALNELFAHANDKFNAGLFADDTILNNLVVSDKTLKNIIEELYYPKCPYAFDVLPIEILGTIYERFLGKVIQKKRKTKEGYSVEIVEKNDVKAAGGVYYTPQFVVEYIVNNTVGELVKDKSIENALKLKICDPACGSGSFLVGAFKYLMTWYLNKYTSSEAQIAKMVKARRIYLDEQTQAYKLTVNGKKEILLANIYGVDIDQQAVEVTKLSLFLALLENEGLALSGKSGQGNLFKQSELDSGLAENGKILPSMLNNIKNGNSLVDIDYWDDKVLLDIGNDVLRKIKPFDWQENFPQIFANGGFDAVIGNPPYFNIQKISKYHAEEKPYFEKKFSICSGAYDIAYIFIEKAMQLLNNNGKGGFILLHKFFNSDGSKKLRDYLVGNTVLDKVVHFGAYKIFPVNTYTCIINFSHKVNTGFYLEKYSCSDDVPNQLNVDNNFTFLLYETLNKASELYGENQWIPFASAIEIGLFNKIYQIKRKAADCFSEIFQGLATSNDKLFVLNKLSETQYELPLNNKVYELEPNLFKPFLKGEDVQRYADLTTDKVVFFPYEINNGKARCYELNEIKAQFPKTYQYIKDNEAAFKARESGKAGKMSNWYSYIYPKNLTKFDQPKLSSMEICACHPSLTFNFNNLYHATTIYSFVKREKITEPYSYFLAILNSKLFWWFIFLTGDTISSDSRRVKSNYVNPFPIPEASKEQIELFDALVRELMANKRIANSARGTDKSQREQLVKVLENKINKAVYALYNLNDDEIQLVEATSSKRNANKQQL